MKKETGSGQNYFLTNLEKTIDKWWKEEYNKVILKYGQKVNGLAYSEVIA